MKKFYLTSIITLIILFVISLSVITQDDELSYSDAFINEFNDINFYKEYYHSFNSKILIIPIFEKKYEDTINNINDEWLSFHNIDNKKIKKRLKRSIGNHLRKFENIPLSALNLTIDNSDISFCLVFDHENQITRREKLLNADLYSYFLIHHELEHCGRNSIQNPIFSKNNILKDISLSAESTYHETIFSYYTYYIEEMYADIAAIEQLRITKPYINWSNIIADKRKNDGLKGDFFHNSHDYIKYYYKYRSDKLNNQQIKNIRSEIEDFFYLNGMHIMPINKFVDELEKPGVYLPK